MALRVAIQIFGLHVHCSFLIKGLGLIAPIGKGEWPREGPPKALPAQGKSLKHEPLFAASFEMGSG